MDTSRFWAGVGLRVSGGNFFEERQQKEKQESTHNLMKCYD